jgi:hypothetical protein|tara:strand:+ start:2502 stop:3176 length:675 start_codon:yes stop_codon:yes gene_type:complete
MITFALTSCGRFNELQDTLVSFMEYNTAPIERYIIIDDSGDLEMKKKCTDFNKQHNNKFEFIFNKERIGQIKSIDKLYSYIDTEYIFHCEDDWEFYQKGFIEKSLKILKDNEKILLVWLREQNDTNEHTIIHNLNNAEDVLYKTMDTNWREGWGGFTFNPSLRRLKDYNLIKPFAQFKPINERFKNDTYYTPELEISIEYAKMGFKAGIMLNGSVRHTGWGKQV